MPSKTQKFAIMARRTRTGKQSHVREIVEAKSRPAALREYGCNAPGKTRVVRTSRGWQLTAEPVA